MSCVFCQINRSELPAYTVYRDNDCHGIMDKFPLSPGHVIVLSHSHVGSISELSSQERASLMEAGNKIGLALKATNKKIKDVHYLINDGPEANQHVPHVHLHVIPRYGWDLGLLPYRFLTRFANPLNYVLSDKRLSAWAEEIKSHLL